MVIELMNLSNRTELFMNFKRVELELKKKGLCQTRVEFRVMLILIEMSRTQTNLIRLDSFSALFLSNKAIYILEKAKNNFDICSEQSNIIFLLKNM